MASGIGMTRLNGRVKSAMRHGRLRLVALNDYCKWLNTPQEIGGIREDLAISGDNANPVSN